MEFKINGTLNVDNILKYVSPIDIFKRYSDGFVTINRHFKSEFRKDSKPSAVVYFHNGTFLYKDFGEDGALNCFQFVGRKFGLTFKEVLERINFDFNLNLYGSGDGGIITKTPQRVYVEKSEFKTIITVKRRDFKEHDLIWWGNQSWTYDMLKMAKISPIEYFRLTSERKRIDNVLYKCDDYSYNMDYYFHNGVFRRKLYFPKKEPFRKWLSNVDNPIVS